MDKNTIIETLDYLFEKFGIAVDWTTENVMPYVEQLAEKIVTYKIVTNSIGVVLSILAIIGCCIYAGVLYKSYKLCKSTEKDTQLVMTWLNMSKERYFGLSTVGNVSSGIAVVVAIIGVLLLILCGIGLIQWIFIPELKLIEYVSNLVSNAQV